MDYEERVPGVAFGTPATEERMRPTISLLSVITFVTGLALGFAGCVWMLDLSLEEFPKVRHSGEVVECSQNLSRIGLALQSFKEGHGVYPTSQYELVPTYLEALPLCPAVNHMTYRTTFGSQDEDFLVECCGENHGRSLVAPNYPAYGSLYGLEVITRWTVR